MKLLKIGTLLLVSLSMTACVTQFAVTNPDEKTGYYATGKDQYQKATTVISEKVDLTVFKSLAYVQGSDFFVKQTRNIGYFDEVLDKKGLESKIIEKGLQDKVTDVSSLLGLNNLYRHYQPFLYVSTNIETKGDKEFVQLIAKDPSNGKTLFTSEAEMDFVWSGVSDQNTFYPLFNSFIDWLKYNQ